MADANISFFAVCIVASYGARRERFVVGFKLAATN
jgi:hypothetical protein